jgi:hypothetical protein
LDCNTKNESDLTDGQWFRKDHTARDRGDLGLKGRSRKQTGI